MKKFKLERLRMNQSSAKTHFRTRKRQDTHCRDVIVSTTTEATHSEMTQHRQREETFACLAPRIWKGPTNSTAGHTRWPKKRTNPGTSWQIGQAIPPLPYQRGKMAGTNHKQQQPSCFLVGSSNLVTVIVHPLLCASLMGKEGSGFGPSVPGRLPHDLQELMWWCHLIVRSYLHAASNRKPLFDPPENGQFIWTGTEKNDKVNPKNYKPPIWRGI